ncbi:prostamide/prostaglandin F synthase-like isoform X2 [Maniola jurtina]|uniref:prostamide/prostaglandin F synthase-like isoform X2 n=1 Tax=Maniola jurtina TaxID=191418 RepID=UPI001E68A7E6|nr:prostamide/prostaglandin F synthase-like isoform X2 [Maniola jurtina]
MLTYFKSFLRRSNNIVKMSVDLSVIGAHKVKSIPCGEVVEMKSFWQDQDVAIIFFRRWGCIFCRLWAKELGEIAPILKKNNIKLVGIGLETAGSKEFIDGKFFDGDLYYVEDRSTYQTLGFKRFNVVTILTSLLWKQSREAIVKGKSLGLHNDLIGDGLQNGGALLIKESGELLLRYVQDIPADWLTNMEICKVYLIFTMFVVWTQAFFCGSL